MLLSNLPACISSIHTRALGQGNWWKFPWPRFHHFLKGAAHVCQVLPAVFCGKSANFYVLCQALISLVNSVCDGILWINVFWCQRSKFQCSALWVRIAIIRSWYRRMLHSEPPAQKCDGGCCGVYPCWGMCLDCCRHPKFHGTFISLFCPLCLGGFCLSFRHWFVAAIVSLFAQVEVWE